MNEPTRQSFTSSVETATQTRYLFWIAAIISGISLVTVLFEFYLFAQQQVWQLGVMAGFTLVLSLLAGYGALLSDQGQPVLGVWLTISGILAAVLAASMLLANIAPLLGIATMLMVLTLALQALPKRYIWVAIVVGVLGGTAALLLDWYKPFDQLVVAALQTYLSIAILCVVLLSGFFVVRHFSSYNLYTKLVTAFLVLALASLSVIVFWNDQATRRELTQAANQSLFAAASQTAAELDAFIEANLDIVGTEAQLPILAEYLNLPPDQRAGSEAERRVAEALRSFSYRDQAFISSYALLDLAGQNVIDTQTSNIGQNESERTYFQIALESGLPYISPAGFEEDDKGGMRKIQSLIQMNYVSPVEFEEDGKAYLYFSSLISDANKKIVGVLRARYSAAVLQELIVHDSGLAGPQSFAILLDENHLRLAYGQVSHGNVSDLIFKTVVPLEADRIAELHSLRRLPSSQSERLSTNLAAFEEGLGKVDSPEPYFTTTLAATGSQLQAAAVKQIDTLPWLVVFAQPQQVFLAPIQTQTRNTLIVTMFLTGLVTLVAIAIAERLTKPITELTVMARRATEGDLTAQVPVRTQDETGQLAIAFNSMTERLRNLVDTLEDRIFERTRALEASAEISRQLTTILDLEELLQYIVNQIQTEFKFYHTHIDLVEKETGDLVMAEGSGQAGQQLKKEGHRLPEGQGIVGTVASTNQHFLSNNVDDVLNFVRNRLLPRTRSELAVPLRKGEKVLGVLDIQSEQLNRFTTSDVSLIQAIADQTAIAIDNARLVAETQSALREVERLNRRLTLQAWEEFGQEVTTSGYRFTGGPRARVRPSSDAWLPPMEQAAAKKQLIRQSFPGNGDPPRAELAIPLVLRGQVIGVLGAKRDKTPDWNEEELAAVESIANQIALALENARLAKEQEKTIVHLKEVDRLKSDFLTSMSHELRTPLNSIIGFADVLLQGIDGELNEMAMNDIRLIYSSGQHLLALINDVLDLAKIEAGKLELVQTPVDVSSVLKDVLATSNSLIKNKPVEIVVEAEENLPRVYADRLRFSQVLLNLVSNAAKFTDEGTVTIRAEVQERFPDKMYIAVTDTGVGIDPGKVDTIFDRFRQADSSTTRKYGGSGLGLAICKQLVEMHGGEIGVMSELDIGSTFYFTIPLAETISEDESSLTAEAGS